MKKLTLALLLGASCFSTQVVAAETDGDLIAKGEYLAQASDCTACHTEEHGKKFAGGKVIHSPVGDIIATNITPSKSAGIGNYTEEQFADAVRLGKAADGSYLYPAMPYTAYARFTDEDIHALYAYFMNKVQPVDQVNPETSLAFPMNLRFSMAFWNALFLDEKPYEPDTSKSDSWNRGRYLADGPAHCSTCHTPRGFLMQERGDDYLAGSQVGPWYAPNITSDKEHGIGSWSHDEIKQYLKTGRVEGKAQAAGSMAEAITNSFQYLSDSDLEALTDYIQSVPARATADQAERLAQGKAGNQLSEFRGKPYNSETEAPGARLYSGNCASCHGYNGQGTEDQYYPSLYHNTATGETNPSNLIATILYGVDRDTQTDGHVFMPPFGDAVNAVTQLSNQEVADLSNYILAQYGRGDVSVSAEDVAVIRQGGAPSPLLMFAQVGIAVGAVVVLLLIGFYWRRCRRCKRD